MSFVKTQTFDCCGTGVLAELEFLNAVIACLSNSEQGSALLLLLERRDGLKSAPVLKDYNQSESLALPNNERLDDDYTRTIGL